MENRLLLLFILCLSLHCLADDADIYILDEAAAELSETQEIIAILTEFPLALSYQKLDDLLKIDGITPADILLLNNIVKNASINSADDLISQGFPQDILARILPYIYFSKPAEFSLKISSENVYRDTQFTSNRLRTSLKIGKIESGCLIDRDPDENFKDMFLPFYLKINFQPMAIMLGYYRLNWGLGILHAPTFSRYFSRSGTGTMVRKRSFIKPYTSASESGFLKGGALQLHKSLFSLNCWYSQIKNEIEEKAYGTAIIIGKNNLQTGIFAQRIVENMKTVNDSISTITDAFSFFSAYNSSNISLQSEFARADGKNGLGINTRFGTYRFSNSLCFRSYAQNFPQLHGNPISRKSDFGGEKGIYYGFSWKVKKGVKLDFYSDLWNFDKRSNLIDLPTAGNEQMINLLLEKYSQTLIIFLRQRLSEKYIALEDSQKIFPVRLLQSKTSWIYHQKYMEFKTEFNYRMELIKDIEQYAHAFAAYQQIVWKTGKINFWLRFTAFHCQLPIYLYENNIKGQSNQICLTGDGIRFAVKIRYTWQKWKAEAKYFYQNAEIIKSGAGITISCHI